MREVSTTPRSHEDDKGDYKGVIQFRFPTNLKVVVRCDEYTFAIGEGGSEVPCTCKGNVRFVWDDKTKENRLISCDRYSRGEEKFEGNVLMNDGTCHVVLSCDVYTDSDGIRYEGAQFHPCGGHLQPCEAYIDSDGRRYDGAQYIHPIEEFITRTQRNREISAIINSLNLLLRSF